MSSLPIHTVEDPMILLPSVFIDENNARKYRNLAQRMLHTCKLARGAGLAAPQVGENIRLVVTTVTGPLVWLNPVIIEKSEQTLTGPEGCLSVPRKSVKVTRHLAITVLYMDLDGHLHRESVSGLLAVVLQHEIDHLDGILITTYEEKNDQTAKASD